MKHKLTRYHYNIVEDVFAKGSEYGPLQSDGYDYLCPDCGGYGSLAVKKDTIRCPFCDGEGTIGLKDERVFVRNEDEGVVLQ